MLSVHRQQSLCKRRGHALRGPPVILLQVIIDCVGGDDYWEKSQDLLLDDGIFVTLVGSQR